MTRFIPHRRTIFAAPLLALSMSASALDSSLVTALDKIGGNLLGHAQFDAVQTADGLNLHLSTAQSHPVEIILLTATGRAQSRLTVGGGAIKLEYDPNAGTVIPCIVPETVPLNIAPPPADSGKSAPGFTQGQIQAFAQTGQNLLGGDVFDAAFDPQPDPPALRLYFSQVQPVPVNIVLANPSAPDTAILRMTAGTPEPDGELHVHFDQNAFADLPLAQADLDAVSPGGAGASGYLTGSGSKDGFTLAGYVDATGGGNGIGEFTVIVHRDSPDASAGTAVTSAICKYTAFDNLVLSGGTATFHSVGDCTVLRADGSQSSFPSDNTFGIVDNGSPGPGVDTVDVNFSGASGISVPGGFLNDGNFVVQP